MVEYDKPNEQRGSATYDICIIGAGVAGASLACYLKDSGYRICIVERDWSEQDRIVGELLQPDGVRQLKQMGLELLLSGIEAQEILGYSIIYNGEQLDVAYPEEERGRGLRNGKFMQRMRTELSDSPNITRYEGTVKELTYKDEHTIGGIIFTDKATGGQVGIDATLTIVSDGFFSKFRKEVTESEETVTGYFLGMVLKDCQLPHTAHGHVFLTDSSPFLCYPISDRESRLLIDFPGNAAPRKGEALSQFLSNHVRPRMTADMLPAFDAAVAEGKFKVMPNHYMPGHSKAMDGVVVVGDALNMRHPLTGGGMTVTLRDVHTIGKLLMGNKEIALKETRTAILEAFYASRGQHATVNILADALYNVMSNDALKKACFDYLAQGGKQAAEPVALLSGLNSEKSMLTRHFFAVALKGGAKEISNGYRPANFTRAYYMLADAFHIICPLIKNEANSKVVNICLNLCGQILRPRTLANAA